MRITYNALLASLLEQGWPASLAAHEAAFRLQLVRAAQAASDATRGGPEGIDQPANTALNADT